MRYLLGLLLLVTTAVGAQEVGTSFGVGSVNRSEMWEDTQPPISLSVNLSLDGHDRYRLTPYLSAGMLVVLGSKAPVYFDGWRCRDRSSGRYVVSSACSSATSSPTSYIPTVESGLSYRYNVDSKMQYRIGVLYTPTIPTSLTRQILPTITVVRHTDVGVTLLVSGNARSVIFGVGFGAK